MSKSHTKNEIDADRPRAVPTRSILAGLVLCFSASGAMAGDITYIVRAGDNPWSISERYLHSMKLWPQLVKFNRIVHARRIPPGTPLKIPEEWLARRGVPATALAVEGNVLLIDAQGRQSRLKQGDLVAEDAVLKTGSDDNATLGLMDESRVLIKGNSEVRLRENSERVLGKGRSILLDLRHGALENQVEKASSSGGRFEIQTPAAVAAVRGTSFRIAADGIKTTTEVIRGGVDLGNDIGVVEVPAGYATSASSQTAPEPPRPLLAAPDLTGLPQRIERVPTDLPIPAQAGAVAYRTQIAADAQFATLLFDQTTVLPVARVRDLPDSDYHLRVRAVDAAGLEGFDARHLLTIDARPEPPFLIAPVDAAKLGEAKPGFAWTRRQNAASYRIQIARDPSFKTLLFDQRDVAGDSFSFPDELAAGEYFWRVAAISPAEGQGPFGSHQSFRRVPAAPAAMAVDTKDRKPVIRWLPGGPDERYQLQVARGETFDNTVVDVTLATANYELPVLTAGRYQLRARTIAGDGYVGAWGATQQFAIEGGPSPAWLLMLLPIVLGL